LTLPEAVREAAGKAAKIRADSRIIFPDKLRYAVSPLRCRCVTLELMVRSLTLVRRTSPDRFRQLSALLQALGFENGAGWSDEHSKGAPFLAPVGSLELVDGPAPTEPDVLIEVRDLDTAHQLARKEFRDDVGQIEDTTWKSRIFSVRLDANSRIGFWAFNDPERSALKAVEGALNASGMRFGIVVSRWNSFITERLLQGALDCLRRSGAKSADIHIVRVPGSFEIPSAARLLAESGTVDAIIALGCLIRGETTHYEHIATEVTRGIGQSAQETGVPHSYGVLTCENLEQAIDRAGLKSGNKGWEAAITAIEMVSLKSKLKRGASDGR
jgi:6,7-dimethyl-8-ribityllumazine synthase